MEKFIFTIADLLNQVLNTKNATTGAESNARNRKSNTKTKDASPEPSDYTQVQVDMVSRIKRCKDYYEVLNVTKESTDSEIRKSYKKLALSVCFTNLFEFLYHFLSKYFSYILTKITLPVQSKHSKVLAMLWLY